MAHAERKLIRLPASVYATPGILFSITIGTKYRAPIFDDLDFGSAAIGILRDLRGDTGVAVYAYCLMPDHVHLLIAASERMSVVGFVQRWKSLCYREWTARGRQRQSPWQRSFWDHGLRVDEDPFAAARYIVENPVRSGLVQDFHQYPLCGSFEWQL